MKKDASCGSLSVEVVLILVPFMFCFMTLLNISRIVQAEVIIHHAITQSAKEISTYSYVLTKTGIAEKMIETNGKSAKFRSDVDNTISKLTELGSTIGDIGSTSDINNHISTIEKDINSIQNTTSNYIDDPRSIATGVFAAVKSAGREYAMKGIAGKLAKGSIEKQLSLINDDPDSYLQNIGVVDGIEGLDFSETHYMDSIKGKGEIKVIVTFTMKNNVFPMFDFGEHEICL